MKKLLFGPILLALLTFSHCNNDDDDVDAADPVRLSIADVSVNEGDEYLSLTLRLQLDGAAEEQVTALISTSEGTAESNKDFIPFQDAQVVFPAGEVTQDYEMTIAGDLIFEEDEFFEVTITSVQGPAQIEDGAARVDLLNDDADAPLNIGVAPTINWEEVVNLPIGSEPSFELFNFGQPSSIPNAEFTTVATLGDTIIFESNISQAGDTLLYFEIIFDPPSAEDFFDSNTDPISAGDSVFLSPNLFVIDEQSSDFEVKYDLVFYIGRSNGERVGPYVIDPKIRIQPK